MPRAAAPRGKRKAAASVDLPASSSSSSSSFSDTLQLPKRPHNASSKRVYAAAPRAISPLLSPKLPLPLHSREDDQPPLELPSELDSELLPSGLSTSPERFLSPNKAYHTSGSSLRNSTLSPAPASPFRSSPSSPSLLGLTRTPNKRRFSPSSDAAFWDLSPLSNARSQYPPRHSTPRTPLDSPASTALFRSPHAVTPRTSRRALTTFGSPSPSRARSLTPSLNVAAADNSLQLPPVLPSPLGERGASGDSMQQLPTPRTLFLSFPWNTSSRSSSSNGGEVPSTPNRSQPSANAADGGTQRSPHQSPSPQDDQAASAIEYGEDSVDSLASVFSRTTRSNPNPLVPLFFSPSRVSHRSSSLLSSRTHLRTPSSSHSRASTSSSASKKASFSILASSSPAELSCVALQAVPVDGVASGKARQRLSFAAEEPQRQPQQPTAAATETTVAIDEQAVKEEPIAMAEDLAAAPQTALSTPLRSRMTEFIMIDDGLMEQPTAEGEAEQRLLFAYRASADGHAPSELFPASPLLSGVQSFRPRSYTFATRKDGKVNVSTTPPFSRLDRMLISPSSAALFTPPSPSPSTLSSSTATSAGGTAPVPIPLSSFTSNPLSFSQSEHEERSPSPTPSASLQAPSSSDVISVDGQPVKAKSCNCKKSQCLKLYCECFAHGRVCVDCNCSGCHNTDKPEHQEAREKAIVATRERDSNAFYRAAPLQAKAEKMKASAARKAAFSTAASTVASPVLSSKTAIKQETVVVPPKRTASVTATAIPASFVPAAVIERVAARVEPAVAPAAVLPVAVPVAAASSATNSTASTPPPAADSTPTPATATAPPAAATSSLPARKGCNCKKSKCLKKYCECFQLGIKCTAKCKCLACLNGNNHQHDPPDAPQADEEKGKESAEQAVGAKEGEDRVRGAFLQVKVESHLACGSADNGSSQGRASESAGAAATAATNSLRQTATPSKMSAWRLFPGGSRGSSVPPLSNAPPIPVQPLAPFTLPAPFEIFHQLSTPSPPLQG